MSQYRLLGMYVPLEKWEDDHDSGAESDLIVARPVPTDGWFYMGQFAHNKMAHPDDLDGYNEDTNPDGFEALVVRDHPKNPALAPLSPSTGFSQVWGMSSPGLGLYTPNAFRGFHSMGDLFDRSYSGPRPGLTEDYRMVATDCLHHGTSDNTKNEGTLWDDFGSKGASGRGSVWSVQRDLGMGVDILRRKDHDQMRYGEWQMFKAQAGWYNPTLPIYGLSKNKVEVMRHTVTETQLAEYKAQFPNDARIQGVSYIDLLNNVDANLYIDWNNLPEVHTPKDGGGSGGSVTAKELAIGYVIFDVVCLAIGGVGLRNSASRGTIEAMAEAAGPVLSTIESAIAKLAASGASRTEQAWAVFNILQTIWSGGCLGAVLGAFVSGLSWYNGLLYGVTGMGTVVAALATDGAAFVAEVVVELATFGFLVSDSVAAVRTFT